MRFVKLFVIAGGVILLVGSAGLLYLIAQRAIPGRPAAVAKAEVSAAAAPWTGTVILPGRVAAIATWPGEGLALPGGGLALLVERPDGGQEIHILGQDGAPRGRVELAVQPPASRRP
ncbi:MAG: hypothetical protein HQL82_03560 [Magnetococcales bacterium]|nr:hypothetical protein [Magnetococcales bacterium]